MNSFEKLHRLRGKTKNQQELAFLLEVSLVTLNSWLREKSSPRKKHQEKISQLYGEYFGLEEINEDERIQKKEKFLSLKNSFSLADFLHSDSAVQDFLVLLTYNSNSIEGSTVTQADTYEMIVNHKTFSSYSLQEQLEVQNHKKAFFYIIEILKEKKPFTEKNLLFLHTLLMAGILENAGQFRYHPVRILGSGVATANFLKIPSLIKNFLKEFNSSNAAEKDILFLLAKSHAIFEKIHPFSDGNGRIGRLLLLFLSLREKFPPLIIPQEKKSAYYKYLQEAQIKENYSFLEVFLGESVYVT